MRTVGVEEHLTTEAVVDAWRSAAGGDDRAHPGGELAERLAEAGPRRIAAMDEAGLDVQVMSLTSPGLSDLPPSLARDLQVQTNDEIAALVAAAPDRLQGFATLGLPAPDTAADELRRAVTSLGLQGAMLFGRTGSRNLDDAANWPLFEAAEALRAPLYIHPQVPQAPVVDAIYSGFGDAVDAGFARFGIGWHYESGIQFLRLALAGVLDRFPDLRIMLGHWGEVVLFYLDRVDGLAGMADLPLSFNEYARRHLYVTAGGLYSHRYLRWAADVVGVDRLMFASDYPYRPGPDGGVEGWLAASGLSDDEVPRVASGNWDALVSGIRR